MEAFSKLRKEMVDYQIRNRGITNKGVLEALEAVPREEFVLDQFSTEAYDDGPLPIDCDQTISQPYIVAIMTELLEPKKTDRVLEIGTGSGYQAAVLSLLVNEVYTLERHKYLVKKSSGLLNKLGYKNIHVIERDGTCGYKKGAPYDKIVVTAATKKVPKPLIEQLKEGGILVAPVGGSWSQILQKITKKKGKIIVENLLGCRFVPLIGEHS